MKIYNVHERSFRVDLKFVETLLDNLSGSDDKLWPHDAWPSMEFDKPLGEGAKGGHGPVRYHVSEYFPGKRVIFQFDNEGIIAGIDGRHVFEIIPRRDHVVLRHIVDAACTFREWVSWHLIVGPLHDALLEDALDRAEAKLEGNPQKPARWSIWVRFIRYMMARMTVGKS